MLRKTDQVIDPTLLGHPERRVGAAVVNDQDLDRVDALDPCRQVCQRRRERLFLV